MPEKALVPEKKHLPPALPVCRKYLIVIASCEDVLLSRHAIFPCMKDCVASQKNRRLWLSPIREL